MRVAVIQGSALAIPLPDKSVQMCCTSPPYWKQRDYGTSTQIGQEPTPGDYIDSLVSVFNEVHRVLRNDGTLWLNLGDTSAHKMLVGIPWRVALALAKDKWLLRSEIIWEKSNPMPESAFDRPSRSHEQIFLFSKRHSYYYDHVAIMEETADSTRKDKRQGTERVRDYASAAAKFGEGTPASRRTAGNAFGGVNLKRNARTVWKIASKSSKLAHFAMFPPEIPLRCIKAGTSEMGCCAKCQAPRRRLVEKIRVPTRPGNESKVYLQVPLHPDSPYQSHHGTIAGNRDPKRHVTGFKTVGWKATCKCDAPSVPCRVLDPFGGGMTTLLACEFLGRDGFGLELSRPYCEIGYKRIRQEPLLTPRKKVARRKDLVGQAMLF